VIALRLTSPLVCPAASGTSGVSRSRTASTPRNHAEIGLAIRATAVGGQRILLAAWAFWSSQVSPKRSSSS
jgi:hypothetical protein